MVAADPGQRQLVAVAGALLDQGRLVHGLSLALTAGSLLALAVLPVLGIGLGAAKGAWLGAVALAGLGELYLAIRIGFDAALFRQLAGGEVPDLAALDAALLGLALVPAQKTARPLSERIAGARRLFRRQAMLLALQVLLLIAGAALPALGRA